MASQSTTFLTEEEYLAIERKAETKSEYFRGEMFAMSGGSFSHASLSTNIVGELRSLLRTKHCRVLTEAMRLRVSTSGLYTYPDVMVVCGKPEFVDGVKDTLVNPVLIFEVLSTSTEAHDRGFKLEHYQKIPSVREFVMVSQTEPRVEVYRRQEGDNWLLINIRGLDATVRLESVDCSIAMDEIYLNIEF
ncbi:MAG: Uma2 family endonuclease [Candidatus Solibacter usitatus]|nr:Uma2 family endonuclease [Candidatus Solibacter usitatus]